MATPSERAQDPELALMRATATVHAVRREIRPLVDEVVTDLSQDPLGKDSSSERIGALATLLGSDRVRQGRAAREQLESHLGVETVQP